MATQLRMQMMKQIFCDCGRRIERDGVTGAPLAATGSSPICLRCKSLSKAWKTSAANPDNNPEKQRGKRGWSPVERCSKAQPWATWAVTL